VHERKIIFVLVFVLVLGNNRFITYMADELVLYNVVYSRL